LISAIRGCVQPDFIAPAEKWVSDLGVFLRLSDEEAVVGGDFDV
jgi:hypothetical protein